MYANKVEMANFGEILGRIYYILSGWVCVAWKICDLCWIDNKVLQK